MRRLKDYLRFIAWQAGFGYIALWAIALWTLDFGSAVFGGSGVCHPDAAKVLFYWVCDPAHALSLLAALANTALTATVWAPVYVAAATVRPEAAAIAIPILLTHLIGLPTAIFVAIRVMLILLQWPRKFLPGRQVDNDATAVQASAELRLPRRIAPVKARGTFGLRGART
jgi:hypothetical protein